MKNNFVFFVGDGRRVRFWEDWWCSDEALSRSFPSLYALATSKEVWVSSSRTDLMEVVKLGPNICFSPNFLN